MNTFGDKFRITLFGESHGPVVGVVIDGVVPGLGLAPDDFTADLTRRRSGAAGTTARAERDVPELVSGVYRGYTTGAPVTVLFRNEDTQPDDYRAFVSHPRPSHADWVAARKYRGFNDPRGGGRFSGRLTAPLVAAGVIAKKMLGNDISICAHITEIGGERDRDRFGKIVGQTAAAGDSVGGTVECEVTGAGVGLGEPFFDSVESVTAHILFSIPGVKGVEFGDGFGVARMRGSEYNDPIISADGATQTNHAGGINGGITNGNPIVVRVAVRPTATIGIAQQTFNMDTDRMETLSATGRHDSCITLRMPVIVEAAFAIALVQFI